MSTNTKAPYQTKRVRRGLRVDRVKADDLQRYHPAFFCDDCVHYDRRLHHCTMGYAPLHTRSEQLAQYDLAGTMAFCRFCEIDS
jgi:hypothetical protein